MAANTNTAIDESGITYIRRFIGSPPTYTSNSFTDGNKSQKVRKQSATYLLSSEGKTSQHGAHQIEKGRSPNGPRPSPRRCAVDSTTTEYLHVKLPCPSAHTSYSKVQFQHYFITLRSLPKDNKTLASVRHLTGLEIRSRLHRGQHETHHCYRKTRQAHNRPSSYALAQRHSTTLVGYRSIE